MPYNGIHHPRDEYAQIKYNNNLMEVSWPASMPPLSGHHADHGVQLPSHAFAGDDRVHGALF